MPRLSAFPPIWLLILIIGLPQLSENVYTPSLPVIADVFQVTSSMVEYTLTVYLFGFALGTLFWGTLSDQVGRKKCIVFGLIIFMIACLGCYHAHTIQSLLWWRGVQAFGGSIGSVLGQALCRDSFTGAQLGRVLSVVGSALALFPAIGPFVGGIIAEIMGWAPIFLLLFGCAFCLVLCVTFFLGETHPNHGHGKVAILLVARRLFIDRKVVGFGVIVAGVNGIIFSYFSEGSFYLIKGLGLSPSEYGLSFIGIAISTVLGGFLSRWLQGRMMLKKLWRMAYI